MLISPNQYLTIHSSTKYPFCFRMTLTLLWEKKKKDVRDYWKSPERKTSVLIGHGDGCGNSQETTPQHATGHRGWSRRRTPGGGAGARSVIRQPLLLGHLYSWHNAPSSPCHRTLSTGGHVDKSTIKKKKSGSCGSLITLLPLQNYVLYL